MTIRAALAPDRPVARTALCLDRIERFDPELKGMITTNPTALADAEAVERRRDLLPDAGGLVVSLKDNIDTAGLRTTMGSGFFADHVPNADATVTARLRRAGCIIIGKANLHEFAFGGTTQNPHHGLARNPWNLDHVPGGSSGGSGSTVAAGLCEVSLGTDTGGSIRIPAAVNGVVGLRPTHGRVPNTGCFPVSAAHDTIGPLARTVAAAAAVYEVIAGYDPADATTVAMPVESWASLFARGVEGLKVGIPEAWCMTDLHPDVEARIREAIAALKALGVTVDRIALPGAEELQRHTMAIVHADGAATHAGRLDDTPGGFGPDVLSRLREGEAVTSRAYAEAMRVKERWTAQLDRTFGAVDMILTPTCPIPAPRIDAAGQMLATTRDLSRFTYAWSMAGIPALSVPCGFTAEGLPVGMQIVGPRWSEAKILALGAHYQGATAHHLRRPALLERP